VGGEQPEQLAGQGRAGPGQTRTSAPLPHPTPTLPSQRKVFSFYPKHSGEIGEGYKWRNYMIFILERLLQLGINNSREEVETGRPDWRPL
jgi:hypothetical protein